MPPRETCVCDPLAVTSHNGEQGAGRWETRVVRKTRKRAKSSKCRNRSKRNNGSRTRTYHGLRRLWAYAGAPRAFVLGSTPALSDVANPPLRTCPRQSGRQIRAARVSARLRRTAASHSPSCAGGHPQRSCRSVVVGGSSIVRPCGVHTSASPRFARSVA